MTLFTDLDDSMATIFNENFNTSFPNEENHVFAITHNFEDHFGCFYSFLITFGTDGLERLC